MTFACARLVDWLMIGMYFMLFVFKLLGQV